MRKPPFSKDDDLLSHLLIDIPLFKHTQQKTRKMDPKWKPVTADEQRLQEILADLKSDGDLEQACKAMERYQPCYSNIRSKRWTKDEERDVIAFKSHIRRYLSVHAPDAPFQLFTTDRYLYDPDAESELTELSDDEFKDHKYWTWEKPKNADEIEATPPPPPRAGPLDLGVRSKEDFEVGEIIPRLLGRVHDLTDEQDDALRAQTLDFSVTMNAGRGCFQALFGPARFVNVRRPSLTMRANVEAEQHDCNANVELTRRAGNMCFEVIRPIKAGDEILSDYGDSYFGFNNECCKCATCEKCDILTSPKLCLSVCYRNERGAYSKGAFVEEDPDLSDITGRVTRSREVLIPLTRAERLEIEEKERRRAERAARLALWEATEGALGKRKRELEEEARVPAYLRSHIDRDANHASRLERSRRRSEGLPVPRSPIVKKMRRLSQAVEPVRNVPAYLRLGVPQGQGDRLKRSLRRLGMDLSELQSLQSKKKPEKRSLEQQIKDMNAKIRSEILGTEASSDEEQESSNEDLAEHESGAKVTIARRKFASPKSRVHVLISNKPRSAPAVVIDTSRRSSRRSALDFSTMASGQKLSLEQEVEMLSASVRASVYARQTSSHSNSTMDVVEGSQMSKESFPSCSSEEGSVVEQLLSHGVSHKKAGTRKLAQSSSAASGRVITTTTANLSESRRNSVIPALLSSSQRLTRNAMLAAGAELPSVKDLVGFSPLASLSSKRAGERRRAIPTESARRQLENLYGKFPLPNETEYESMESTPASHLFEDAKREESMTSSDDSKMR